MPDYFIEYFTKTNDIVLDPFSGLATTARSAKKLGRRFIGIELNENFFDLACRNIKKALDAPDMFFPRITFDKIWDKPYYGNGA